jgi:uncharacterized protein with NRDE domain
MCLIVLSLRQHPIYKLILAANRDEFYARKTAPASFWPDHNNILGGRDLEVMRPDGTCGTWMGMTTSGKIAMVTNYRDFKNLKTIAPSRGHLVTDFLIGDVDAESYLKEIEPTKNNYNGFNLILGDVDSLFYLSNYKEGIDHLAGGLHGLSNHLLESPWPKVLLAKSKIEPILKKSAIDPKELFEIMRDESRAADDTLPHTGIGLERERALSSMFIKTDGYGSRCSTVVMVTKTGGVSFIERTYHVQDFTFTEKNFEFTIR